MHPALEIARKDLRQRVRDRSAILLAFVVPLGLAAIFSLLFGPASTPRPFDYAVVDHDGGAITKAFSTELLASLEKEKVVTVTAMGEAEARRAVRDGDLDSAFVFPAGFSAAVQSQRPVRVDVVGSVDSATGTDVARSLATAYVDGLNAVRVAVASTLHARPGLTDQQVAAVAARTLAMSPPVTVRDVSTTARVLDTKTYFAAGMAVFFLLFTVQFGISSLLEERSEGTLSRLLASPVRRSSILVGKLLTSVLLGILSLTVMILASHYLLGARWGDPLAVGLLVVAGVLAGTGITAVVASMARTVDQAGSWQAVVAVTLGLLGGVFFPIQQTGSFMATLSLVTPHAWFIRGLSDLAGGGGVAQVLVPIGALLLIAAVTGGIAVARIARVVAP